MDHSLSSLQDTEKLAEKIAASLKPGDVLALSGDLGVGKTTFTQSLAKSLRIKETVTSPTFVIMKQYSVVGSNQGIKTLTHVDAYRLTDDKASIETLGIEEIFNLQDHITIIEWPENIKSILPKDRTRWLFFSHTNHSRRLVREEVK